MIKQFFQFCKHNKLYFLIPFFITLFVISIFIFLGQTIAPGIVIYTF